MFDLPGAGRGPAPEVDVHPDRVSHRPVPVICPRSRPDRPVGSFCIH